jgi:hypothetical protein
MNGESGNVFASIGCCGSEVARLPGAGLQKQAMSLEG